uniref:Uncharacterized protein n=1 Tax=Arundo donax TaxID=35708 RepID=A0A0A8ZEH1_ARUDO
MQAMHPGYLWYNACCSFFNCSLHD